MANLATSARAPKLKELVRGDDLTLPEFESWKGNLLYVLSLDKTFSPFLKANVKWSRSKVANRGLTATGDGEGALTAETRATSLEMMLGQIANFCPVIHRSAITNVTCLDEIWQQIRAHYGFQTSGSTFLNLGDIKLENNERHEDLYQRLMAFFEDALLTTAGSIKHHGDQVTQNEEFTPTLENTVIFLWLSLIDQGLPKLVQQKYAPELRTRTLASIKLEISGALPSLLDELRNAEDGRVMRTAPFNRKQRKHCILCETARRPSTSHHLSECRFLPAKDKLFFAKSRQVTEELYESDDDDEEQEDYKTLPAARRVKNPAARKVDIIQSPYLYAYHRSHTVKLTLDTGATTNLINHRFAKQIGLRIYPASQFARQADGTSSLNVKGEIHCSLTRNETYFQLDALVVDNLADDVLAGMPFLHANDIAIKPKSQVILIGDTAVQYGKQPKSSSRVRRTQSYVLRASASQQVVFPGEFLELKTPSDTPNDTTWALEPRTDTPCNAGTDVNTLWPTPQAVQSVGGVIRVSNDTDSPIPIKRGEHLCQVSHVTGPDSTDNTTVFPKVTHPQTVPPYSRTIDLDPGKMLSADERGAFENLNKEFDQVFDPVISKYNGRRGDIKGIVNMGPVLPPQHKGRVPQYSREKMLALQAKCDELEAAGVLSRPESSDVTVEYLNLSFLIKKPSGGSRLVTSFGEVARYSKPQPSLMPSVDKVLLDIAAWKYIIATDLLQSFYQIPLSRQSMKFCGICTPFKGIRIYNRCAMGMPGSETALEELMSRVLGNLIADGKVAKLADDLYVGGNSITELLSNWREVLSALNECDLRLSAKKTVICPQSATILGWIWREGTLSASSHKVNTLSTVSPPATVQGLRSFIGAYKVLSRVLPKYAAYLHPLDCAIAGRESRDKIEWTDDLTEDFQRAQQALKHHKTITLPKTSDQLWIVTDGSVKEHGIGATLYIVRHTKTILAGFFNAKLKRHQVTWLPCEIEALAIGAAVRHFAPYIVQSNTPAQVLTDSQPCVQAFAKLQRGEFSNSSRVTTFLSTVSRYQLSVQHIKGVANIPSDFASRHSNHCPEQTCQICKFIREEEDAPIRGIKVQDIMTGTVKLPFISPSAWLSTQQECYDLRRVHAHLTQGTRPSKKETNIPDVKRYLKVASLSREGLVVVRETLPFSPSRDRIVVPRSTVSGLLTAIHYRLDHPTTAQMKSVFCRYFFALDFEKANTTVSTACIHCASLQSVPKGLEVQSSNPSPTALMRSFAADIIKRNKLLILLLRETVSSFTSTTFVKSECAEDVKAGLISLLSNMGIIDCAITVRVDPAPAFRTLSKDHELHSRGITLELGHEKNVNKNPVAEKGIRELGTELLKVSENSSKLDAKLLAVATARLNSRIRFSGLSAFEIWTQRDQVTGDQLPLQDRELIISQSNARDINHIHSAKSKANGRGPVNIDLKDGDLVFLKDDRNKLVARDKYIVITTTPSTVHLRKFTANQFRARIYIVKPSDCYKVPAHVFPHTNDTNVRNDSTDEDEPDAYAHPQPVEAAILDPVAPPVEPLIVEPAAPAAPPVPPQVLVAPEVVAVPPAPGANPVARPQRRRKSPARYKDYKYDWDSE